MTTISLKMSADLEQQLKRLARKRGTSRSAVIRDAVERLIKGDAGHRDSCLAAAAGLVGSVDGPADLSYNKKRLKGFGR